MSGPWWRIHVRASEGTDGCGPDRFYTMERKFKSLKAAKRYARRYEKAMPRWLRELRIYRETA